MQKRSSDLIAHTREYHPCNLFFSMMANRNFPLVIAVWNVPGNADHRWIAGHAEMMENHPHTCKKQPQHVIALAKVSHSKWHCRKLAKLSHHDSANQGQFTVTSGTVLIMKLD